MASVEEKSAAEPRVLVKSLHVTQKASQDTMDSDALTAGGEKTHGQGSIEMSRSSDVSHPSSHQLNPFDTDIEAIITPSTTAGDSCARKTTNCKRGPSDDCQIWPGQDHWKRQAKAAKMRRSCGCLSRLSKRNRLIAKILIGLLIVGIAVGVGFGVSKPLGAGIWQPHDSP